LLVVTTSYSKTEELRKSYPQDNIIIEDFVDFDFILDHTDLFICNGGYGSILISLSKGVPVLAAGIREGKNDVNAHVDYCGAGIDLRTESPKPADIRRAAERILSEPRWSRAWRGCKRSSAAITRTSWLRLTFLTVRTMPDKKKPEYFLIVMPG
jgi:UDP:flavonoid glycosyltransferase YjiC (YdhE family)